MDSTTSNGGNAEGKTGALSGRRSTEQIARELNTSEALVRRLVMRSGMAYLIIGENCFLEGTSLATLIDDLQRDQKTARKNRLERSQERRDKIKMYITVAELLETQDLSKFKALQRIILEKKIEGGPK
jgi:hypothetical protein